MGFKYSYPTYKPTYNYPWTSKYYVAKKPKLRAPDRTPETLNFKRLSLPSSSRSIPRFLSSPFTIRVPFFLILSFSKGTLKQKGQKGTTQEPRFWRVWELTYNRFEARSGPSRGWLCSVLRDPSTAWHGLCVAVRGDFGLRLLFGA